MYLYYLGKLFQAAGMTIIGIDFFRNFPALMSQKVLGLGIAIFAVGWVINRFLLRN